MKLKNLALSIFIALTCIWVKTPGTASEGATDAKKFSQTLDSIVPKLLQENLVPGAAVVALIQNGEVVFKKRIRLFRPGKKAAGYTANGFQHWLYFQDSGCLGRHAPG